MGVISRKMTVRTVVLVFALAWVCACAALPEPQVSNLMSVSPDRVVIVGRIELHPPLQEGEQAFGIEREENLKNLFILYCGNRPRDVKTNDLEIFADSFKTTLEKEFFIKINKDSSLYFTGGTFYTAHNPRDLAEAYTFESPFQVEIRPDDEAVYIGTIQYYRDGSNKLKSVMIRDDYQWADTLFKERFGTSKTLRKALATPVLLNK